ncbi:hypothetical protein [Pleomorphomonas sp. PLEO]|uniref:hypothetical protein n=1 Tax=Pleomorphomonas sp. PLEO TaxID=3239306 RepID=UPI00351E9964
MSDEKLVSVRFVKCHGPYMPGNVAGFDPKIAQALKDKKIAVDPTETADSTAPVEENKAKPPKPPQEPKPTVNPDDVEIPEGWGDEHHLQQIALAKKLKPDEPKMDKARAIEIITTEIERRKVNEQ